MIDTVKLNVPQEEFTDIGKSRIGAWHLQSKKRNYEKYILLYSKDFIKEAYRPRLTITKRYTRDDVRLMLIIEFSVPKLLLGNNLDEVEEEDLPLIIVKLNKCLLQVGIVITEHDLENASVSAFHPSKNSILEEGYTASFVVSELEKINISKRFDLNKTNFRNSGKSLQIYTRSHSLIIYDKMSDLVQPKGRAIDKNKTPQQLALFWKLKNDCPGVEILRIEVRLCLKRKINALFAHLGFPANPRFKDVFRKQVCQKVVQYYWDTFIEDKNIFLFGASQDPKKLFTALLHRHPRLKAKEAIYLVGLNTLARYGGGVRELRQMLTGRSSQRGWYRINKGFDFLNDLTDENATHGWVRQISSSIESFAPLSVEKLSTTRMCK